MSMSIDFSTPPQVMAALRSTAYTLGVVEEAATRWRHYNDVDGPVY